MGGGGRSSILSFHMVRQRRDRTGYVQQQDSRYDNDVMLGCLLFNSTEKMTFLEADRYCKEAYNSSALAEALTEEVGFEIILSL